MKKIIIIAILILIIGGLVSAALLWHPQVETLDLTGYSYFFLFGKVQNLSQNSFTLIVDEAKADKSISTAPRAIFFSDKTIVRQFAGVDEKSTTTPRNIFKEITAAGLKDGDNIAVYSDVEINQAETINATIIERLSP